LIISNGEITMPIKMIVLIMCLFGFSSSAHASIHPQILFGNNDIAPLRVKISSATGNTIWTSMKWWIDRHFDDPYPTIPVDRFSARLISKSAMAYLITNDPKYAQKTHDWIMYYVNTVDDWQGGYGNGGSSYIVHDIVLGYDWIQNWWIQQPGGEGEIQQLKDKLAAIVPLIDLPTAQGGCGIRHRSYEAIGIAGYAFQGEIAEAENWIIKSKTWFQKYISSTVGYGTDGYWADGPDYASLEQSQLMGMFFSAAKYHQDLFWDTEWSRNQKYYWSYMWTGATKTFDFFPKGDTFSYAANIKDVVNNTNSGMSNIGYYLGNAGPTMFYFSYLYDDPVLAYIAKEQVQNAAGTYYWDPSLLWVLNPDLGTQSPTNIWPLSHYFSDFEAVIAKSDWTSTATQLHFKSGVVNGNSGFLNNQRTESYEAHAQEDANGIMIYSRGEYLVAKDAYTTPRYNNTISTILSDGGGQVHDGEMWGSAPHPGMQSMGLRSVIDSGTIFYTLGDGSPGYNQTKLNKFDRHIVYFRPDIFVVFDEVGHSDPHRYDWNLQMEYDKSIQVMGNNQFKEIGSRTADMNITFIKPSIGQLSYEQGTHPVTRCTNISKTSPCELGPVINAPYISFYPTVNVAQTQFLAVLETKAKGSNDSSISELRAANGVKVQIGSNNFCLAADTESNPTTIDSITTSGRLLCWHGNEFIASPAKHIEFNSLKITTQTGLISIGMDQLIGQFTLSSNSELTFEYPGLDQIKIDGTFIDPSSIKSNICSVNVYSGKHSIELIVKDTPTPKPGDFNQDEAINGKDLLQWYFQYPSPYRGTDYTIWRTHVGL
jgi:hypothetical protein